MRVADQATGALADPLLIRFLAAALVQQEDRIVLAAGTTTPTTALPWMIVKNRCTPVQRRCMGIGYDTQNLRVSLEDADGSRRVLLDGLEEIGEYAGAVREQRWDRDPTRIDGIMSQAAAGAKLFHYSDALGSVYGTSDQAGAVRSRYTYDAYGERIPSTEEVETPWGYAGRRHDSLGNVYFRHRYFVPHAGRFSAADPMGMADGPNRYLYAHNQPVDHMDPLGLYTIVFAGDLIPLNIFPNSSKKGPFEIRQVRPSDFENLIYLALADRGIIDPAETQIEMVTVKSAIEVETALMTRAGPIASSGRVNVVYVGHSISEFGQYNLAPGNEISGTEFGRAIISGLGLRGKRLLGEVSLMACDSLNGDIAAAAGNTLKRNVRGVLGKGSFSAHWGFRPNGQGGPAWVGWSFSGPIMSIAEYYK